MMLRLSLDKLTKSALKEMVEDLIATEAERSLPIHKRGKKERREKDAATEDADDENDKLADLAEETRGAPKPVSSTEEDYSEEGGDLMEDREEEIRQQKRDRRKK